jgi:hypothetical protein
LDSGGDFASRALKGRPLRVLWALLALQISSSAAAADGSFRALEAKLRDAQSHEVPLLAPSAYALAARSYEEADKLRRGGGTPEAVQRLVEAALQKLEAANAASAANRQSLAPALALREATLKLDPGTAARVDQGDRLLRDAAARFEAGDRSGGEELARSAVAEYTRAGAAYLRETKLAELRNALPAAEGRVPETAYRKATSELEALNAGLNDGTVSVGAALARIDDIWKLLFPPEYRSLPHRLTIGTFTLYVEKYETSSWDFVNGLIIKATGTAWTSFECSPSLIPIPPFVLTTAKKFRVVETVQNPSEEISLADAQRIDPSQGLHSALTLHIPTYAVTSAQISQAIEDIIKYGIGHKGDIRVHFDQLTIQPGPGPDTGVVLAGTATYPTTPPQPETITLHVAGFTLSISVLTLKPTGATATGELEFPVSIADPGTGHPGRVSLGEFTIGSTCEFHKELPSAAFGPWSVGGTEVLVQGTGVVADFEKSWAAPGLDPSSAAAAASWRGAILQTGATVPATEAVVSNSGYLRAKYGFTKAEVTGSGLKGHFVLGAPYQFLSLEPYGYRVSINVGYVDLSDSAVDHGVFQNDRIVAPDTAARASLVAPVRADYQLAEVDANLDLLASVKVGSPIRWGEYTGTPGKPTFYEASGFTRERFYLSGTWKQNYFPLDASGDFVEPNAIGADLRPLGMQGLSVFLPQRFIIYTPDTPAKKPLRFRGFDEKAGFLNISFGGVHASLNMITERGSDKDLGPTYAPFYVGVKPFQAAKTSVPGSHDQVPTDYRIAVRFVSSATYDCDMRGTFHIPVPVDSDLDFTNLAFTSTALISGAKAPFTTPFKLSYWGLDMVKKPGASAGAVISVRTGQVFFTAAGIREQRHFDAPFYLIWGEMLADGSLKRLVFDYSGVGQKFDRFPFTTSFVRLSNYVSGVEAYLKVAGTAHFDVFGPKYLNIEDVYDTSPSKSGAPWNSRRIDNLKTDSDPAGLFQSSDKHLTAKWSDDFGSMDFNYDYDKNLQDGFLGTGHMGFLWINGTLGASIVLKAERSCMSVSETTHRDFTLGPVSHFGFMTRTTGCGCIENGQLQRVVLSAELESSTDVNILLRSAGYGSIEWSLTPTVSTLEVSGDMYLTILVGGNIEASGKARFTVDRAKDFVEGEIDAKFDVGTALGAGTLTADGQLNWHLGKFGGDAYQSLQGKVAVQVLTPVAGVAAEGGFYIGINAPKAEAWVLAGAGSRYKLNMTPLPDRLTGIFGYAKASSSINLYVFSGGIEAYAGVGGFVLTPAQVIDLGASTSGLGPGLPFVIGHAGVHVWGEILGGLVSADGTVDLQVIAPYPFSFEGTLGLEGCVVWVVCGSVDVTCGVNSSEGLFVR